MRRSRTVRVEGLPLEEDPAGDQGRQDNGLRQVHLREGDGARGQEPQATRPNEWA